MAYREYVHIYQPGLARGFPEATSAARQLAEQDWATSLPPEVRARHLDAATGASSDALRARGDTDGARWAFQRALEVQPDSALARHGLRRLGADPAR